MIIKIKNIIKLIILIELLSIPLFLLLVSVFCRTSGCEYYGFAIPYYFFPAILLTSFVYIIVFLYERLDRMKKFNEDKKTFHLILAILIALCVAVEAYYLSVT